MKKVLHVILADLLLSGCSLTSLYEVGKPLYIGGKKVIIKHWEKLPTDVQDKLIKVDKGLVTYDEVREDVKKYIVDANSTMEN